MGTLSNVEEVVRESQGRRGGGGKGDGGGGGGRGGGKNHGGFNGTVPKLVLYNSYPTDTLIISLFPSNLFVYHYFLTRQFSERFLLDMFMATGTFTISARRSQERFEFSLPKLVSLEMKEDSCSSKLYLFFPNSVLTISSAHLLGSML